LSSILRFMIQFYVSVKAVWAEQGRTSGIWFDTDVDNVLDS
jgi:hypothetical protein